MQRFRTLDDLGDVTGKRVLVRTDLNVPMEGQEVSDTERIDRQAPTLRELSDRGAKVVVLSHFGRPKGKPDSRQSLRPVVRALANILGKPVAFADDCVGPIAKAAVEGMRNGDVLLLENTRFHAGEEANDPEFAKAIAKLGDLFVNDAFSAAHRAHATTTAIAHLLPSAAGRSMEAELCHLEKALGNPERPLMAVIGGAKVSTKITLLENLVRKVETLVIGGAMANTFLAAEGLAIGKSLYEPEHRETAQRVIALAADKGTALLIPLDVVSAPELRRGAPAKTVGISAVPADEMILDVGPETIAGIGKRLHNTRTLIWNGPLGAFETPPFDKGTTAAARLVAEETKAGKLLSVAGGGDTVAALNHAGVAADFSYVSTAGGAFLEWLEGRELPGVAALSAKEHEG